MPLSQSLVGVLWCGRHNRADAPDLAIGQLQPFIGLRARHFMHEMAVDIEQAGSVRLLIDKMIVPDFVIECASFGHWSSNYLIITEVGQVGLPVTYSEAACGGSLERGLRPLQDQDYR